MNRGISLTDILKEDGEVQDEGAEKQIDSEDIKSIAMHKAVCPLLRTFQEFSMNPSDLVKLTHNVCSGTLQDCIASYTGKCNWLHNWLKEEYPTDFSETKRIFIEVEELRKMIIVIIRNYLQKNQKGHLMDYLMRYQKNAPISSGTLKVEKNWGGEMPKLMQSDTSITRAKFASINQCNQAEVELPTRLHWAMKYPRSLEEQCEIEYNSVANDSKNQITNCKKRIEEETASSGLARDMYYIEINALRERLKEMNTKYHKDFKRVNEHILHTKYMMDKLNTDRKHLMEKMKQFKRQKEALLTKEEKSPEP